MISHLRLLYERINHNAYAQYFTLFILGLSNTLAFAPYSVWPIPFLTAAGLVYFLSQNTSAKRAFKLGFSYGLGWFGAGISWVHVSIDTYGGLPLIASLALMLLLVSYLSLYPALATAVTIRLKIKPVFWPLSFPALWLASEWLRGQVMTGFPWLSLGYTQISSPFSVYAPVIGEFGLSWFVIFTATTLTLLLKGEIKRYLGIAFITTTAIVTVLLSQLAWITPTEQSLKVTLVQGNIKQELRWAPEEHWPTMLKYMDLTRPHYDSDLIVWPEAAIPEIEPLAQDYLSNLNKALQFNQTALITGMLDVNIQTRRAFNNIVVIGNKHRDDESESYFYGHANRYSKHQLLPIGEFIPFEDILRGIAPLFDLPMSSFSRGSYIQPPLIANGYTITPALCYEIAFADQMLDNFSERTDVLLTVSNDAWFGASHGPHQHMEIAQMRALELGRPLVRATNNGVTAITNHKGEITASIPQFKEGVLNATVNQVSGMTPYSQWHNLPIYIFSAISFILSLALSRTARELEKLAL